MNKRGISRLIPRGIDKSCTSYLTGTEYSVQRPAGYHAFDNIKMVDVFLYNMKEKHTGI